MGVEGSIPFSSTTFFPILDMNAGFEPASGADGQEDKRNARERVSTKREINAVNRVKSHKGRFFVQCGTGSCHGVVWMRRARP